MTFCVGGWGETAFAHGEVGNAAGDHDWARALRVVRVFFVACESGFAASRVCGSQQCLHLEAQVHMA